MTRLITIDATAREADSDRRRIEATMTRFRTGSRARNLLEQYHPEHPNQRQETQNPEVGSGDARSGCPGKGLLTRSLARGTLRSRCLDPH